MRSSAVRLSALVLALSAFACQSGADTSEPDPSQEDADGDGFIAADDCDDFDPDVYPGAPEACDGVDNDCNGTVDDGADELTTFFRDADGDGYGTPDEPLEACAQPAGYVANDRDCNDEEARFNPTAREECTDTFDFNCDGSIGFEDNDSDGFAACEDCNDVDATINPNGEEVCDEQDNDCDGDVDEDDATDALLWFTDIDSDGYGSPKITTTACTQPPGYIADGSDCDDLNPAVNPGAVEACDGFDTDCDGTDPTDEVDDDLDGFLACDDCDDADNKVNPGAWERCNTVDDDCDGTIDESDALDARTWYADTDADGWGDPITSQPACAQPSGYVLDDTDCDDTDGEVNPAADEVCNTVDDDCDGRTDEASAIDASDWYEDADSDGWGDAASSQRACTQPSGYVARRDDCDDDDDEVNPAADEVCNEKDDDCDGTTDEASAIDASTWYTDDDADDYGVATAATEACEQPSGYAELSGDCDDTDDAINPAASEVCDSVDNDCDGATDEATAIDASTWFLDDDGDDYGLTTSSTRACAQPSGYAELSGDCDDADDAISPAADEECDSVDNDCDGVTDEASAIDASTWFLDDDGDDYGLATSSTRACTQPSGYAELSGDCDDADEDVSPAADEECDSVDNDCDGATDEASAIDASTWFLDDDGDDYGLATSSTKACTQPSGYAELSGDCDDGDEDVSPAADEECDSVDNDCDGVTDEASAIDAVTYWLDDDEDGFGLTSSTNRACSQPSGYATKNGDCDDGDEDVNPGASEVCNSKDDDCDGLSDENSAIDAGLYYTDADSDGFGVASGATRACTQPSGTATLAGDCDDTDDAISPAEDELCDSVDNDCDGVTDEATAVDADRWFLDDDGDDYGDFGTSKLSCSQPTDYVDNDDDCDDGDEDIYPGADEVCDDADQDCDGLVDEDATDADIWYQDSDKDGYGDPDATTEACDEPNGYVDNDEDCEDGDAKAYPGSHATETPFDGIDTDCDGNDLCTDFDCDGWTDVIWGSYYDGNYGTTSHAVTFDENLDDFNYSRDRTDLSSNGIRNLLVQDFDNDGYMDALMQSYYDGNDSTSNRIFWGSQSGLTTSYSGLAGERVLSSCADDLDEDGYVDVVITNYLYNGDYTRNSWIYWGSNTGYSTSSRTNLPTQGGYNCKIADLDEDGNLDIVFANYRNNSNHNTDAYIYWGSGNRSYGTSNRTALDAPGSHQIEIADFDDDGLTDLFFVSACNTSCPASTNSYVYYQASSGFSNSNRDSLPAYNPWSAAVGDMDGDGLLDIVLAEHRNGGSNNYSSANTYVYYNSSSGFSSTNRDVLQSNGVLHVEVGDFDGNGFMDVVTASYRDSSSDYNTTSNVFMQDSRGWSTIYNLATHGSRRVAVADVNEDGYADFAFTNYRKNGSGNGIYDNSTYVYWGSSSGWSASDRTAVREWGGWDIQFVGPQTYGYPGR